MPGSSGGPVTVEQWLSFEYWINNLAGESASGIFGWLYSQVPSHGRYSGNGVNDAWVIWQAYNNVFGNGLPITRDDAGVAQIRDLMNEYITNFPSDPLGIWPSELGDWNALAHDLGSLGGLIPETLNHLRFAFSEFFDFLNGADLFHLISGPFIAIFGTASSLVGAAINLVGGAVDFATDVMGSFFGSLLDAWDSLSQLDFGQAVQDLLDGIGGVFQAFIRFLGEVMETVTPVVLDLDGDGVELISLADSTAVLDLDGDGVLDRVGWVSPDDALLAFDANQDGLVNGLSEFSFADVGAGYDTDLEGLARYDSNQDNVLSAADENFDRFLIWQDTDGDGVCEAGEARTLAQSGIVSIDLALNGVSSLRQGHSVYTTTTWRDVEGRAHEALDVGFRSGLDESITRSFDWGTITGGADGIEVATSGPINLDDFLEAMGRLMSQNQANDWMLV